MNNISGYYKVKVRHEAHMIAQYSHTPYDDLLILIEYTTSINVYKLSLFNPHNKKWMFGDLTTMFNLHTIGDSIRKIYPLFTDVCIENTYPVNKEFVELESSFY